MLNPVTGHRDVDIDGKIYCLRYTWQALSEVDTKWGTAPNLFDPAVLAGVAEAGLRHRHPEMTAEKLMEISPPLAPLAMAVQEAIRWSCFGNETPPEVATEKKSPGPAIGLWNLLKRPFQRG